MKMQEMMERLLAEIRADRKADRELLQKIMDANAKSMRQGIKCGQAKMIAAIKGKTDAWIAKIKDARKKKTACQEMMGANPEKMEPNPGEEEAVVEHQEIPKDVAVHSLRTCRSETAASQEDMETEPDQGTMQSTEEHQEIPKGEAAAMPVGEPRKRRRVRNLAAERRQKRKERTRGNRGSRRKSAAACRKVSRRAKVAWHKRNLVRRIETRTNYGPRKRLTVTGRKTTSRATVAWHSEKFVRKDRTRKQEEQETQKRRK
jgi:hypothetical protein